MIRGTWEHLTSDVIIEIIALRSGMSLSACAAFYALVVRDMGFELFVEVFEQELDDVGF